MNFKALGAVMLCVAIGCGNDFQQHTPDAEQVPQWLLGTYSRGTRVEDSVTIESEDRALRFEAGNKYAYRSGSAWSVATYDVKVSGESVLFLNGPLRGKQLPLSAVSPNCRILELDGEALFRGDTVAGCPLAKALSATTCETAGTWRKTVRTGTLSSGLFEVAVTVKVEADGFFSRTQSSTTCNAGVCRFDETAPVVGVLGSKRSTDLQGFEHQPLPGCVVAPEPVVAVLVPAFLPNVSLPPVHVAAPEPKAYGACSSDEECTGVCDQGQCTAECKYDVQCGSPGDGMIASCMGTRCRATCATGNACPAGTACADGLCQ
jgi:hypothetical protein